MKDGTSGKNDLRAGLYYNIISFPGMDIFKNAVLRIRDILRSPGVSITGMDCMRHICIYLASRYITSDKTAFLQISEKFAWENIMQLIHTQKDGLPTALDYFHNTNGAESLTQHFERLFGLENTFNVKNPQKHKEILEIMDTINLLDIDCQIDVLGWIYEQHLKTGSSAARDLGQFFTDRFICEYMVDLCKPVFKSEGVPESVCDPSMGTGGFLTAYMKYFKKNFADFPINWGVQQKEVHGCDTDQKVAGVARLNMFMESGGTRFTNILTHDSLYGGLTQSGYDVILANMPFGLKGIKHADCCNNVKKLKIRGTKSEPLFLQLIMSSLNRNGRCAVVVPDGMLVNNSVLHTDTRKHLLEHFDLVSVIKMNGAFFMNTAIQPSILFFHKNGKTTTNIEFWEVCKNAATGLIHENLTLQIHKNDLDEYASLNSKLYMNNLSRQVASSASAVPIKKLHELATIEIGGTPSRSNKAYYEDGTHIWVSVSELNNGVISNSKEHITNEGVARSSVKLVKAGSVLMSFKMSIGKCALAGVDLYTNEAIAAINTQNANVVRNEYLFYYLQTKDLSQYGKGSLGNGSMNKKSVGDIDIAVPTIDVQDIIIRKLKNIRETFGENIVLTNNIMMKLLNNTEDDADIGELLNIHEQLKQMKTIMKSFGGEISFKISL